MNYDYFYDRIQKQEITIDQLYDAICCLEIIDIRLDMDDNPQLIFKSLNSTGLDLSEGDKIRNFILMGLPSKEQEDYYEKYWNKIEVCTKYDVSAFIRDYLSVKQQAIPQAGLCPPESAKALRSSLFTGVGARLLHRHIVSKIASC